MVAGSFFDCIRSERPGFSLNSLFIQARWDGLPSGGFVDLRRFFDAQEKGSTFIFHITEEK